MRYFCEFLHQNNFHIYLVYEQGGDYTQFPKRQIYEDVKLISLQPIGTRSLRSWIHSTLLLYRYCRANKVELIFTHVIHGFPMIRIVKTLLRIKVCVYFKWIYSRPDIGQFARWGLKNVDRSLAVSNYVKEYWKLLGAKFPNSLPVIPDGISNIPPRNDSTDLIKIKEDNNNKSKILFAGRIYKGKGLHLLIQSMSLLDFRVELYVAGFFSTDETHPEIQYHLSIKEMIKELELSKQVHFLGFVDDLSTLMIEMDLVVVPSILPDAQPLVILEAMRSRTLVIGSTEGGIPEILSEQLSFLTFSANAEALCQKIKAISDLSTTEKATYQRELHTKFHNVYSNKRTYPLLMDHLTATIYE
ncbi:MAG: glycosyltransferase family 4 protein [Cyanothece sp. SIO1E1]|nr:glycosyltransferase family 4 protein [Cyanothece sp. SIO1E1]